MYGEISIVLQLILLWYLYCELESLSGKKVRSYSISSKSSSESIECTKDSEIKLEPIKLLHVDTAGNAFTWDVSSLVSQFHEKRCTVNAHIGSGPKGEKGDRGPTGSSVDKQRMKGETGPKGDKGNDYKINRKEHCCWGTCSKCRFGGRFEIKCTGKGSNICKPEPVPKFSFGNLNLGKYAALAKNYNR